MKCPNCGITLRENETICGVCGTPVESEQTMLADREPDRPSESARRDHRFDTFEEYGGERRAVDDRTVDDRAGYDDTRVDTRDDARVDTLDHYDNFYDDPLYSQNPPYGDEYEETSRFSRSDRDPRYDDGYHRSRRSGGRYQSPQKNNTKKALIISAIALVLVVAILGGVIFFVSKNAVSAAELQDAKDKYLPPAQAISIDTSLDDPSNDQIQFKYDDRARIISCSYSVNDKAYDQRYTYDDAQRRVNIETSYRKHPIFTKDIDYGRVKNPDTFENVDGYYLRLGEEYVGGSTGSSSSSSKSQATDTPAPTDPPATDPPTEEPTEEPTEASSDWRDIYVDFLDSTDLFYEHGILLYLDDDDTPELLLSGHPQGGQVITYHVCWISGNEVQHDTIEEMGCSYQESTGNLRFSIGKVMYGGFSKYSFDGSSLSQYQSGGYTVSDNEKQYNIDNEPVSEDEYNAAYSDGDTWTSVIFTYEKATITDQIRNYH